MVSLDRLMISIEKNLIRIFKQKTLHEELMEGFKKVYNRKELKQ